MNESDLVRSLNELGFHMQSFAEAHKRKDEMGKLVALAQALESVRAAKELQAAKCGGLIN